MQPDAQTRHSPRLPELRFALSLLYTSRLLIGMHLPPTGSGDELDAFDERIEDVTDELVATELLHEAAVLAGDTLL